ncbi:Hypothetical protein NTJ_09161 [Nesidiocoris tenuis]|uniref:Uncharacterized protein n=1 Tax=Nesidiocoris tenuis TaxID=355587 RepID=A0ABN7AVY9_9HEMI|nr:Hypothetical protein NTJ_09161 [Nesidiocoris tenuis]
MNPISRFATKKLVSAVGEYETQLNAHKQLHHLLKESLKEKDQQLQTTINNLEKMRTQAQGDNSIPRRADVIDDHFNLCRTH